MYVTEALFYLKKTLFQMNKQVLDYRLTKGSN